MDNPEYYHIPAAETEEATAAANTVAVAPTRPPIPPKPTHLGRLCARKNAAAVATMVSERAASPAVSVESHENNSHSHDDSKESDVKSVCSVEIAERVTKFEAAEENDSAAHRDREMWYCRDGIRRRSVSPAASKASVASTASLKQRSNSFSLVKVTAFDVPGPAKARAVVSSGARKRSVSEHRPKDSSNSADRRPTPPKKNSTVVSRPSQSPPPPPLPSAIAGPIPKPRLRDEIQQCKQKIVAAKKEYLERTPEQFQEAAMAATPVITTLPEKQTVRTRSLVFMFHI